MKIVSVITDAEVVDRILRSLHAGGGGEVVRGAGATSGGVFLRQEDEP